MANLTVNISQAVANQAQAIELNSTSPDTLGYLFSSFFVINSELTNAFSYASSYSSSATSVVLQWTNGVTKTYTGTTSPQYTSATYSYGTALASSIVLYVPGSLRETVTGNFSFGYTVVNSALSFSPNAASTLTNYKVEFLSSTASPIFGRQTIQFSGNLVFDINNNFSGTVSSINVSAEKFLASEIITGNFYISGNASQIGAGTSSIVLTGVITGKTTTYLDGSVSTISGTPGVPVSAATAFDYSLLNTALSLGPNVIDFNLPASYYENVPLVSGAGNDVIHISGGGGRLTLDAGAGNDTISGGSSNDVINGGAGVDAVIFTGNKSSYSVSGTAANLTVADLRLGSPDGTDALSNVESLRFADGTYLTASLFSATYTMGSPTVSGVNATSVSEGATVNFNVNTTNVAAGSQLSYILSGVSSADVTGGLLTGTVTVGADGKAVIPVSLVADQSTEGAEILTATVQGQSASVTVNDTSTTPVPIYAMGSPTVGGINATSVSEGATVNFNVNTTNVPSGTSLSYTLSGVSAADVTGGSLTGTVTVGADGKAVIPVSLVADQSTEGAEILTATVQGQSASVTVNDTSTTPVPIYAMGSPTVGGINATSVSEGATVNFNVNTTNVASGTSLSYTLSGVSAADVTGGLLTGTVTVGADGKAVIPVSLVTDQLTEGAETLTATVQGQTASVTVSDTSTTPVVNSPRTKYFVLPSSAGANFTDFDLSYGSVTLTGEQVIFVGSSAVDALFVRPGVTVDFTLSGSGSDKIYLGSNFASYTASITGSVMTLQRGSGATLESVSFIKSTSAISSDSVIFADGALNSLDLYNNLKTAAALPALSTTETSIAPLAPALAGSVLNASIKAFALYASGDTFAPAKPGVAMTVVGSVGVDTVYVPSGGVVDCTLLGSGQDLIYLTGNWGDYTKVISGSVLTFSRSVDGYNESVRVVGSATNISLNDHLVFADGAVFSGNAKTALTASLSATINAVAGYDPTLTTPGIGTSLMPSALNGVTDLEVGSNIVLNYSANVSAVAGKFIHIVNDGGTGFRGESTVNTLNILVTDITQVSIVGGKVTLNPTADLDLANNYHITIDAGAFTTIATGAALPAYDGTSTLHFSTVTPGTTALANAAASHIMNADGTLGSGHLWLDIEAIGSPSASTGTALDLSANSYALVAKDYDAVGGSAGLGYDGVKTADFYVAADNFGANDLLYIDNLGGAANDLTLSNIINLGTPPTTVQFSGTGLGGFVSIALAGSTATFDTIAQLKTLLGAATSPVISA